MKNRIISIITTAAVCISLSVSAEDVKKEKFGINVGMLSERQIKEIPQSFTKIDLTGFANRDIKDEVEGDGTGGWSDQGDNDLRMFDKFGAQEMLGVPFNFIDPAKNSNKAVLGLRGQNDMELPTSVNIPVNKTTAGAYFIQASPWCSGVCGTYTWVYEDGSEAYIDIEKNVYICDFWGYSSYDYCRPAWSTTKSDGSKRTLYMFAMNNPYPEKKVTSLRLETSGGGAYIMIMAITLTDSGPYLSATESARYKTASTYGWYEYSAENINDMEGSAIDFSYLLDAPAGKHGRVTASGSRLVFENGKEARFWGVDIIGEANMPDKETAQNIAKRLAMGGVNLVRMRKTDKILYPEDGHDSFNADALDRMMYFISELKKNGIYTYISAISEYTLTESDGVENYADFPSGLGFDGFWDEQLIELQKKHISKLLGTVNPYTGMTLYDDSAVAMIEFADSKSALDFTTGYGKNAISNTVQQEKLNVLFNEFIAGKYSSTEQLMKSWNAYDKTEDRTIEAKNLELSAAWRNPLRSEAYKADVCEFLGMLETEYYNAMKTVSGNILSTCNTNEKNKYSVSDLKVSADTGFTARNALFAELPIHSDKYSLTASFDKYNSPVSLMDTSIFRDMSENSVYGKPFVCGYGASAPNLYFSAMPVMAAAFGGQNSWIPVQYSFANGSYSDGDVIDDFYAVYNNPVRMALLPAAASVYYSLDCIGETVHFVNENSIDEVVMKKKNAFGQNARVQFSKNADDIAYGKSDISVVKTDNIFWSSELGIFEVRTPMAEAMTGFFESEEEMPSFILSANNAYTTAVLSALDGKKIQNAERLLFTAVCGTQNTGTNVNIIKNVFESFGKAPILVETITGTVTLKLKGSYSVWALNSSGQRTNRIQTVVDDEGRTSFTLSSDNKAIQYEIVKNA